MHSMEMLINNDYTLTGASYYWCTWALQKVKNVFKLSSNVNSASMRTYVMSSLLIYNQVPS